MVAPNGSLMYQYLPNGHENVRYDNLPSSVKLWYTELMSINVNYFMSANLSRISFSVRPLWMGLISALLCLDGSRHILLLHLLWVPT